jgi:hypothetical protein
MPNSIHKIELHIVIQVGGTHREHYLHSFNTEAAARKFIRGANQASYHCLGPFSLLLAGVRDVLEAAHDVTKWIASERLEDTGPVSSLAHALAIAREEFPRN